MSHKPLGYEAIADLKIRSLVRRRELELKDAFVNGLSKVFQNVLDLKPVALEEIDPAIMQLERILFRAMDGTLDRKTAVRKINRISGFGVWEIHQVERALHCPVSKYLQDVLDFHMLFSGFAFEEGDIVGRDMVQILQEMDIDMLWGPAVLHDGRITVSYVPDYQKYNPNAKLAKGSPDLDALVQNPRRIVNRGVLFDYDPFNLPVWTLRFPGKLFQVPQQPVWVLPNGFVAINVRGLIQDFQEVLDGLVAILSLPSDFEEGLAGGKYRIIK